MQAIPSRTEWVRMALTIEQFQSQVVASGLLAQEEASAFIAELSGERRPKILKVDPEGAWHR